jgi:hypothetical protein
LAAATNLPTLNINMSMSMSMSASGSGEGVETVGSLIGKGLAEGIVHVLTGPDHLSALVVLTAGSSWRSWRLGALWGVGHSLSLIILTIAYEISDKGFDIDTLGFYFDFIVGILMLLLGLWGLSHYVEVRRQALDKRIATELAFANAYNHQRNTHQPQSNHRHHHHELQTVAEMEEAAGHVPMIGDHPPADSYYQQMSARDANCPPNVTVNAPAVSVTTATTSLPSIEQSDSALARAACQLCGGLSSDITSSATLQVAALFYGLVHGSAGTGGVMGEISDDVFDDAGKMVAFIGFITVGSIFIMSIFAASYGELSGRIMRLSDVMLYRGGIFSSLVSFFVGLLWIVLVDTQQLDNVFG